MKESGIPLPGIDFSSRTEKYFTEKSVFLGDIHDLYLYRLDKKTGKYKSIALKDDISAPTLRKGLKDGSIKLLPY